MARPDFALPATRYGYKGQNGRVNLAEEPSAGGFLKNPTTAGFGYRTSVAQENQTDMLRGNWEQNSLSQQYFSAKNVDTIQNAIRSEVYRRSGDKQWVIDPQSADELLVIMRGMYYQYAKNLPHDIPGQIAELNKLVLDWSVPKIMSEVQAYFKYIDDITHMPVPLEQPVSMSSAGTKSLPLQPFL